MNNRPNLPQIIFGFIALYKKHRAETTNVVVDSTKYFFESVISIYTKTKPVDDQINQMLSEIELQAQTANEFDDFYDLIIKLREKGEHAQTLKWKNEESKLHGLLHALASIIINEYRETEIFKEKIASLIAEEVKLKNHILFLTEKKNGVGVKETREERQNIILELAYLENSEYIIQALDNKSLKSLAEPTIETLATSNFKQPVNYGSPIHLQPNYAKGFYAATYQTVTNIGFDDFISECSKMIINTDVKKPNNNQQEIEEKLALQKKEKELLKQQKKEKELLEQQKKQQELLEEQKKQQELLQQQQQPSQPNTELSTQTIQQQLPQLHLNTTTTQDTVLITTEPNNEIKQASTANNIINYPEKGTSSNTGMYSNSKSTPVLPAHTNNNNNQNRTKNGKK